MLLKNYQDNVYFTIKKLKAKAITTQLYPKPTKLKITTRTSLASFYDINNIDKEIRLNIEYLYWIIALTDEIIGVKYGKELKKGVCKEDTGTGRFGKGKKINLCTIKLHINASNINMRIFGNSSVHLTGCQYQEDGMKACKLVIDQINEHYLRWNQYDQFNTLPVLYDGQLSYKDFKFSAVNSKYYTNFEINQEKLNNLLQEKYSLQSNYEPCSSPNGYQGINAKYMWNDNQNGKCTCVKPNLKNRKKPIQCNCTRISIMVFRTGKITLISRSKAHLTVNEDEKLAHVYNFLNKILETHYYELCNFNLVKYLKENTKLFKIRYWKDQENLIQVLNIRVKKI